MAQYEVGQLVRSKLTGNVYRVKLVEPANKKYCVSQEVQKYAWSHKWLPDFLLKPLF